jgi:hypothetical protein
MFLLQRTNWAYETHAIRVSLQVHLLNQLRDIHQFDMNYALGGHQNFILFNFLQSVITITGQTHEFMKLDVPLVPLTIEF